MSFGASICLRRAPALTAGIVAFVEVLKEFSATSLIRPFNFDTLAIGVYRFGIRRAPCPGGCRSGILEPPAHRAAAAGDPPQPHGGGGRGRLTSSRRDP